MKMFLSFLSVLFLAAFCNAASMHQSLKSDSYIKPYRYPEQENVKDSIMSMDQEIRDIIDALFGRGTRKRPTRSLPEANLAKCAMDFYNALVDCFKTESKTTDPKELLDMLKNVDENSLKDNVGPGPCMLKAITSFVLCCVIG